ncbi:hypothetical protein Hanom_Chr00s000001g01597581 [Helianthus anomalus]
MVSKKRSRETAAVCVKVAHKTEGIPVINIAICAPCTNSLQAKKKTPEKGVVLKDPKETTQKRPKVTIKPFQTAGSEAEKEKKAADKPVDKIAEKEKEIEKDQEKKKVAEKPEGDQPKETLTATTVAHEKA